MVLYKEKRLRPRAAWLSIKVGCDWSVRAYTVYQVNAYKPEFLFSYIVLQTKLNAFKIVTLCIPRIYIQTGLKKTIHPPLPRNKYYNR